MKKQFLLILISSVIVFGCNQATDKNTTDTKSTKTKDEVLAKAQKYFAPLPESADNPDNKVTIPKVKLGKILYNDTRLSLEGNNSCNSCHNLATYGVDNLPTSPGDAGNNGTRNSPTVFNAAFHFTQFWDGREKDVEAQAGGPVLNPVEMNIPSEEYLVKRLSTDKKYQQLFTEAFPNEEKSLTFKNITYAIAAFERELITPSRFDNYLKGDENALSSEEKKGLKTYMDVGCTTCHAGALLGGNMYQKFGLFGDYWEYTDSKEIDEGRMMVTKNEADKYLFKVPSLRNIDKTYPFFHDGSVEKLDEAVRIMAKVELNKDLSDKETKEIVTFLASLTGEAPSIAK
jgi:cytochrome c peroxidase